MLPCLIARCPNYAAPGSSYCLDHRAANRRQDDSAAKRDRRQGIKRAGGRCQLRLSAQCEIFATCVHHRDGNRDNHHPDNIAAACVPCHRLAHEIERSHAARKIGAR